MRDIRYSLRLWLRTPGPFALALATLALGIGANAAIFSVIRSVLLRPLPYRAPQELVALWEGNTQAGVARESTSPPNYVDWRDRNQAFSSVAAFSYWVPALTGDGEPDQLLSAHVTANFWQTLGVQPAVGRLFTAEEDSPGKNTVVIVSDHFWKVRLGGDPAVLGRKILLDNAPYTVIGVMPPGFRHPNVDQRRAPLEVWRPHALEYDPKGRRSDYLRVIARLRPGLTVSEARQKMAELSAGLAKQYPANAAWTLETVPLSKAISGDAGRPLWTLLAAVGALLLIACANIANLLLARGEARRREFGIRTALGCTSGRMMRQVFLESLVLGFAGGVLGVTLAVWAKNLLSAASAALLPAAEPIQLDWTGLVFALTLSAGASVLFGVLPAVSAIRSGPHEALQSSSRTSTVAGARWSRAVLVVAELALTMVLLTGAGLLVRSFWQLESASLGFRPDHVVTGEVRLKRGFDPTGYNLRFMTELEERVARLPGVEAAAIVDALPLSGRNNEGSIFIEGRPAPPPNQVQGALLNICTPGYFRVMQMRLLLGRLLDSRDNGAAPPVAVVNEATVRRYFPGEDPIGKRIKLTSQWQSIVGVIADVRHKSLTAEVKPQVYLPFAQLAVPRMTLAVRTPVDAASMAGQMRRQLSAMDPALPLGNVRTIEQLVSESVAPRRFTMLLLAAFAGLAVLLAAVGIYGVISYSVARRTRELGVRIALGAQPADVAALVLGEGGRLLAIGLILGLSLALLCGRLMGALLYGVNPTDPGTLAAVMVLLTVVALSALWIPARRAARLDPIAAMRDE